jgi:inosine-uridine nucleoside N-ribohydrolase
MAPAPLWIDTDLAMGAAKGDVDDGWALAAAVRGAPQRILGVSSVFGNTDSDTAHRCAGALLHAMHRADLPLVRGARYAGQITEAAERIASLPEGAHVLALGPLTNVAAALARDPSLAERITVSLVGGNPSSLGRWPPLWPFEFNLAKDARASQEVFASVVKKRVFTLDVACALTVGARELRRISRASELGRHLARASLRWLAYAPLRYRALRFPLWDAVPVLDALGMLRGVEHTRRWRIEGKGLLVLDKKAQESTWIERFDVRSARDSLERLIAS